MSDVRGKSETTRPGNASSGSESSAGQEALSRARHDLRTPLNAIIGYSEILQESAQDLGRKEFIADLCAINSAGKRLIELTETIWPEPADSLHRMHPQIELVVALSKKLMVKAREARLESFEADIKRIGSAAQRFRALLDDGSDLFKSKSVVELKDMIVPPSAENGGPTTVDAALPAGDKGEAGGNDDGGFLLVVDDNEMNRDLLCRLLRRDGHKVLATESGSKALEMARKQAFDLVLLDIMMPEMDGYEVCVRLKANAATRGIPVIFITAMGEADDEARGFGVGAVDYITKPIKAPVVIARVRTHLELKKARESLEQQNEILRENVRLREDVGQMTRDDLKTPLQAILSAPALLMKEDNLTPDQVEMLQMMEESGYRMLDIINSSLDLYKIETGSYPLNPLPVDVARVVHQIRGETLELVRSKQLKIDITVRRGSDEKADIFIVQGEETLYYAMLSNLIKNAVEASPEGERILIALEDGQQPEIRIHNQGAIPEKIRGKFFDKYVTSGKKGGKGLGTYAARLVAELLGGAIRFESSQESGTTLIIQLPKPPAETPGKKASPSDRKNSPQEKDHAINILVVEDYQNMLRIMRGMLHQMGFNNVFTAHNGNAAVKILNQKPPVAIDLIVSDWNMPQMSGIELLRYVRSKNEYKDIPFIMVTCETVMGYLLEAKDAGVSDYIIKPFTADTLKRKVLRFC